MLHWFQWGISISDFSTLEGKTLAGAWSDCEIGHKPPGLNQYFDSEISSQTICVFIYLNLSQQLFLWTEAGLDPLVVGAVQLVELGDWELLLIDDPVLAERRQEGYRHVKGDSLDLSLQGLPLLLNLLQLCELRAQYVHYLGEDGEDGHKESSPLPLDLIMTANFFSFFFSLLA